MCVSLVTATSSPVQVLMNVVSVKRSFVSTAALALAQNATAPSATALNVASTASCLFIGFLSTKSGRLKAKAPPAFVDGVPE